MLYSLLLAAASGAAFIAFALTCIAPYTMPLVGRPEIVRTMTATFPGVRSIDIHNENGPVRVQTGTGHEVRVTAVIRACPLTRNAAQKAHVTRYEPMSIEQNGDTLLARPVSGRIAEDVNIAVDYAIEAPPGTDIAIENVNGNVKVTGSFGAVNVSGQNADAELTSPQGTVTVRTLNGRVRLTDAAQGADIETVNGNIYAHVTGGALRAETRNGLIVARVADPSVTECNLTTLNGGITVVLSEPCSVAVDAKTQHGRARSDWPMMTGAENVLQRIAGTIGSGNMPLRMETVNGNIWIARDTS
ncbi:MAG TPA: DUF4097 family beta strand repeat-containing protein [Candidatus Hydrogenedentes bacterium]|nr:DUF4097 family beta strand repeat-containing protein [Candidatus Hydrogenedentota bacterium]HOS03015.1 DUF4097 family beta strand repeat-containing protein [Candidatus Hydrogenedentota bacterium]